MQRTVKELLCFYHLYGNATECKLALIRGGVRSYKDFKDFALHFTLNVLTDPPEEQDLKRFLQYIGAVQFQYFSHLRKLGLSTLQAEGDFLDLHENEATRSAIQDNQRVISSCDDSPVPDELYDDLVSGTDLPYHAPQHLVKPLKIGILEATEAYYLLVAFYARCEEKAIKPHHSLDQCMFDFSAFLTHFSRGFVFSIQGGEVKKESQGELRGAVSHLKRVTLDMRKAMITTIFRSVIGGKLDALPREITLKVLAARHHDLEIASEDDRKLLVYKDELQQVLKYCGFA